MSEPARFHREVGTFALMLTGLGSIIGSGWLFGAWRAAGIAGPGALWAWVLGAAIIITVALTYTNSRATHLLQTVPINAPLPGTYVFGQPLSGLRPYGAADC